MIHFICKLYYEDYVNTAIVFNVIYWTFFLIEVIFSIIQLVFILLTCHYFGEIYTVYILSLIYNSIVTSVLLTLAVYEFFVPNITDLRAMLLNSGDKEK